MFLFSWNVEDKPHDIVFDNVLNAAPLSNEVFGEMFCAWALLVQAINSLVGRS